MDIQEIKRYSDEILAAMTERDKSGKGYVCPACGSGTGRHGTGLIPVKGKPGYYHCFSAGCPFEHGDILELIGKTYNLPDTAQQIQKAGELIHMDFSNKNKYEYSKSINNINSGSISQKENKNAIQNSDKNGETKNEGFNQDILKEQEAIGGFINSAAAALMKSQEGLQYLAMRGIKQETAARYKLGYVPNYGDGLGSPALIIPTGKYSYTARSITTDEGGRKVRKKKAGDKAGIFGIWVMKKQPPVVFICEGELDALSIMQEGLPAIATGGGTSKRETLKKLKEFRGTQTTFYIIPDHDKKEDGSPDMEKGIKAGQDIFDELKAEGIRVAMVNVLDPEAWPQQCKDCNDFLKANKDKFHEFLINKADEVAEKELGRVSGYLQEFISQIAGSTPPIPTGFTTLDNILEGGLHPGLFIIGAISSLGKTTFGLNLSDKLAANGQDVIIYSMEMSRFELISKIISRRTALACLEEDLPMSYAKTNLGVSDFNRWEKYSQSEKDLLKRCMDEFAATSARHLYIREGMQSIGTEEIRRDLERYAFYTGRRPVVIVDYVQILKSPDVRMSDKQRADANIVELKRISRDFNITIIGISSFNRESYTAPVSMSAVKESGGIEYTCDLLAGLQYLGMDYIDGDTEKKRTERVREIFKENEQSARQGKAISIQCKILKNRSGSKSDCVFQYFPMFNLYIENNE